MSTTKLKTFRIALTGDFYAADGSPKFANLGLDAFDRHPGIECASFEQHLAEIHPEQLCGANAAVVLSPRVSANSLTLAEDLLAIGRYGVGYDSVDVAACTAAEVAVMISAGAVDRSVAEATVGWMLALTHRMLPKDRLVRECDWDTRTQYMGCELRDRTLGVIGLGGIGQSLIKLLAGFGMQRPLVYDPYLAPSHAAKLGVRPVTLAELLEQSDFVSIHCPLTDETRGLIGRTELSRMKRDAYLINTARGGIVDEDALCEALAADQIRGAAIDCFAEEPVIQRPRLADFDNVLLAPHSIAWTNELFRDIGRTISRSLIDLAEGRQPQGIVNPEVFESQGFQTKWERLRLVN